MAIIGFQGLSAEQIKQEVAAGGRFVQFEYNATPILTFKASSPIFFIRKGQDPIVYAKKYILISQIFGWLGIPGIFTNSSVIKRCREGGHDVTNRILPSSGSPHLQLPG
jgi:hypothetical protein